MDETQLKDKLLKESEEFQTVFSEHRDCEAELAKLQKKAYLSENETLREKELKKKKLALKDRMYRLMSEYGRTQGGAG